MNITPRATEVKAVVELLETEDFDSANDLAKAIIKRLYAELLERDWWFYTHRSPEGRMLIHWGPFTSEIEAGRYVQRHGVALDGDNRLYQLFSPARQIARHARHEAEAELAANRFWLCARCGHPSGLHEHEKHPACVAWGCTCKSLVKPSFGG